MPIKKKNHGLKKEFQGKENSSKEKNFFGAPKEKDFFSGIKNYVVSQEEKVRSNRKKQFAFFILGFVFFYLLITLITGLVPQESYKEFTGKSVQAILKLQGIQTASLGLIKCNESSWIEDSIQGECYSFIISTLGGEKQIIISWLCTGILEIIILASAILSSFGISWRKKIIGAILAVPAGIIFNLLRVWVTINLILSQSAGTAELAHDMLFRIVLFIYITGYYVIWFYCANREK